MLALLQLASSAGAPPQTGVPASTNEYSGRRVELEVVVPRVDLFSYEPSPGTVVFAGYGSTLTKPTSFRFSRLERLDDGFFVKLSYLFRMK